METFDNAMSRRPPAIPAIFEERIGISAIAVYEPPWVVDNAWFGDSLPRKFVQHTGIRSRRISQADEVTMAVRAVESMQREMCCSLQGCTALVFVSPSVVPAAVVQRPACGPDLRPELLRTMARRCADRLGLSACRTVGLNWFCSGYTRALSLVQHRLLPRLALGRDEFVLVVTVSRISQITDYGCPETAPLFGDLATATVLARSDSQKYPVHFELLAAIAEMQPADKVLFDFHWRENVIVPTPDGGRTCDPRRLVFSLDGLGIGDAAPRAMANATYAALRNKHIPASGVQFVVPHQAGAGIVRLATMKLDEIGVHGKVVNGLTSEVGNTSSCSIPFALRREWQALDGVIACPSAGVASPGKARIMQGCVLLQTTAFHRNL
jgi:3-oxoacyl-[acyl-carrier-protein] synthase III